MGDIMESEWMEMIKAFLKLTPEERAEEAEKRLDQSLQRMAEMHGITPGDAYAMLVKNRDRMYR